MVGAWGLGRHPEDAQAGPAQGVSRGRGSSGARTTPAGCSGAGGTGRGKGHRDAAAGKALEEFAAGAARRSFGRRWPGRRCSKIRNPFPKHVENVALSAK